MSAVGPVRLRCTATGVDIGYGWGLYVSAQDNDLGVSRINPDAEPWADSPLPTPDEVSAARTVLRAVASGHLTLGRKE